ncbi:hypothetical protein HD554DRAFT_1206515 [Boletus coccyginus]|nr:hypothetical protein HD554DRAFT_1206515 [Boletus coccyginus]
MAAVEDAGVRVTNCGRLWQTATAATRGTPCGKRPFPPTRPMVQTRTTTKKKRRGKPGELCQLNLDVLFLLAAYVHPLDLLNFARTCKSLRELLMDKASEFVWRTARRQVQGLPDCPADMTEPEYANLLCYARCHGYGKHAKKVLWNLRRRYCPGCRDERLRSLSSCPDIILDALLDFPVENLTMRHKKGKWVDKEQVDLFIQGYDRSSDKVRFLSDKLKQHVTIRRHASKCKKREEYIALEHAVDLEIRRQEREAYIFERLGEHGYEPEITYFGRDAIQESCPFGSKPLTDKEWAQVWPDWFKTMNDLRSQRIDETVYQPRRNLLTTEYNNYVVSPSSNTPSFDHLPHLIELSCFPPFRDIIKAPEDTRMRKQPFESAFRQLPVLVDEWRKQFDTELAELVKIPSQISRKSSPSGRAVSSSSETSMQSFQVPTDKLRLACAVFDTSSTLTWHPDVFFSMLPHENTPFGEEMWECKLPIQNRFNVKYLEDAPYIVHACGLDPNVATVEDMDRLNARLKCLVCNSLCIRCWKGSLQHALQCRHTRQTSYSQSPRWQLVSNEYMDAIQAAQLCVTKELHLVSMRCLLCHPRVGDAMSQDATTMRHLVDCHRMKMDNIKQGVHYTPVGMHKDCAVKMDEEGGQATFKEFTSGEQFSWDSREYDEPLFPGWASSLLGAARKGFL